MLKRKTCLPTYTWAVLVKRYRLITESVDMKHFLLSYTFQVKESSI